MVKAWGNILFIMIPINKSTVSGQPRLVFLSLFIANLNFLLFSLLRFQCWKLKVNSELSETSEDRRGKQQIFLNIHFAKTVINISSYSGFYFYIWAIMFFNVQLQTEVTANPAIIRTGFDRIIEILLIICFLLSDQCLEGYSRDKLPLRDSRKREIS